jgi:hypothetical protein
MMNRTNAIRNALSGGTTAPRRGRVAKAIQPSFGAQLSRRVGSGAITGVQARQTAQDRQLFQKAFGDDWRTKVYGQGGAKGISGPFAEGKVRAVRSRALERARAKVRGNGGISAR